MSARRKTRGALQTNIVRIDGQRSVYVPILKQGGDSNTITIVNGMRRRDQAPGRHSRAAENQGGLRSVRVCEDGDQEPAARKAASAWCSPALMILLFLGSLRATFAVLLSIPLSALAAFLLMSAVGGTINTMVLGGLALAFSRLIDNSVVVLENIFRHLEMGSRPRSPPRRAVRKSRWRCWPPPSPPRSCSFRWSFCMESASISSPPWRWRRPLAVRLLRRRHDGGAALLREVHQRIEGIGEKRWSERNPSAASGRIVTHSTSSFERMLGQL